MGIAPTTDVLVTKLMVPAPGSHPLNDTDRLDLPANGAADASDARILLRASLSSMCSGLQMRCINHAAPKLASADTRG